VIMPVRLAIHHRTTYRYALPVTFGTHRLMVRPREGHDVHIESSALDIAPAHAVRWLRDTNGNSIAVVDFTAAADQLNILSEVVLMSYEADPTDFHVEEYAAEYPFVYDAWEQPELTPFQQLCFPRDAARLQGWLASLARPGQRADSVNLLKQIMAAVNVSFRYQRRDDPGVQTPAETLEKGSGSCRDLATFFLEACRCLGLAARFISGYLHCADTEPGSASTHAWTEVYLPGAGWKGFDPTSGVVAGADHVPVAMARHPERAAPISGSFTGPTGALVAMEVDVRVQRTEPPLENRRES
jgi:transglutaminase-like putative cysteine protease